MKRKPSETERKGYRGKKRKDKEGMECVDVIEELCCEKKVIEARES